MFISSNKCRKKILLKYFMVYYGWLNLQNILKNLESRLSNNWIFYKFIILQIN